MKNNTMVTQTVTARYGKRYDVIVIGGGPAGVSAALAAARQNKQVMLIEKGAFLGGLATMGLIVLYNPGIDDANGRRIVGGISEELMHLSVRYSYGSLPEKWKYRTERIDGKERYQTVYSPTAFALSLNDLLTKSGVQILYDALFCDPIMSGKRCTGVMVETKAGRWIYEADCFIDCSGDGDLVSRAGAKCIQRRENYLSYWSLSTSLKRMQQAIDANDIGKAIHIELMGVSPYDKKFTADKYPFYGIETPEEVAEFINRGQQFAFEKLLSFDKKQECLVTIPSMADYRKTRAIVGLYTLSESDRDQHFEDSIGCIREDCDPYLLEIPYRCLISADLDNVLVAGRIVSCDGTPRDTIRLIAVCAQTGEAAGIASALVCENNDTVHSLDVQELQSRLVAQENILHF